MPTIISTSQNTSERTRRDGDPFEWGWFPVLPSCSQEPMDRGEVVIIVLGDEEGEIDEPHRRAEPGMDGRPGPQRLVDRVQPGHERRPLRAESPQDDRDV